MNKILNTSNIEIFRIALKSLKTNKGRSALTILGVVIGVAAVVIMVALGTGAQNFITQRFADLGSNLIIVAPGKIDFSDDPAKAFSRNKLEEKHIDLIENEVGENLLGLSPSVRVGEVVHYKTKDFFSTVIGVNHTGTSVFNLEVGEGRFFTKAEEQSSSKVVILGKIVKEDLFGQSDAIGEFVEIGDDSFLIIGMIEEKNQTFDDNVIIPHTTALEIFDIENYTSIAVKAKDTELVPVVSRQVEVAMLRDLKEDDFSVVLQTDILGSIQNVLQVLTLGLGAIAGISLLVGGIGIMNIMLVSVTERISEIGLRKAVGAGRFAIGLQFISEAVLLSLLGGLIGVILAWGSVFAIRDIVSAQISFISVLVAFGFSLFVGVLFGSYPALKASKLDPIEALRFE